MGEGTPGGVLDGLRVLDLSHQYAGALAGCLLADLGAQVVLVEHPAKGSPIRTMLPKKSGHSMWWKVVHRGKRCITLNLASARGRDLLLRLARDFDVMIENFRPGTLERWGIGPADLEAEGVEIVLLRVSGFGQGGPERDRPGFGTIAEAMSGFAHLNGFPDGPPVFPSTTLADGVAGTFGAFGVLAALFNRMRSGNRGVEVVDVALFEGLFRLIPTQVSGYDQLGIVPTRPGNFLATHGVLRNLYRTGDGQYFVVSAVGAPAIGRILAAAGAAALRERLAQGVMDAEPDEVVSFLSACDQHLRRWSEALPYAEVARRLTEADAVFQRIYTVKDIVEDPQYRARDDIITVPDPALGSILMPGVIPKFTRPHVVSHAGPERGAHNEDIYGGLLGLDREQMRALQEEGVI